MWLAACLVGWMTLSWGASREEVILIGRVGNFDSNLVTIKTETGPAIVPRSSILNPQDIAPGAIVKAALPAQALDQLNHHDDFFGAAPPPPARRGPPVKPR